MIEFKLLEPTQKYIDIYKQGTVAKNHKFWFNVDLLFMATNESDDIKKREKFKRYAHAFELELTYEDLMDKFNVPFSVFIEKFKDVPEIYNTFNFKG